MYEYSFHRYSKNCMKIVWMHVLCCVTFRSHTQNPTQRRFGWYPGTPHIRFFSPPRPGEYLQLVVFSRTLSPGASFLVLFWKSPRYKLQVIWTWTLHLSYEKRYAIILFLFDSAVAQSQARVFPAQNPFIIIRSATSCLLININT